VHKKRRIWITLLALTVMGVIAGCVATAQTEQTVDPQAETATIKRGEISTLVSAQGNVTTDRQASLVFASAGRIADILVDTGDQVSEGDVLARLESDALDRQIERAEAALTTAQARLAQVAAGASKEERASALAALDAAQAGVEGAQARLDQLTADPTDLDIEATELAVALAKNQLWGAQAQRDAVAGNDYTSGANKDSAEAQVLVAEVGVTQAELAQRRLYADPRVEDVLCSNRRFARRRPRWRNCRRRSISSTRCLAPRTSPSSRPRYPRPLWPSSTPATCWTICWSWPPLTALLWIPTPIRANGPIPVSR